MPIEVIWSEVQTKVGTPHKLLRCFRSRGGRGRPHIPLEGIRLDIRTMVGISYSILRKRLDVEKGQVAQDTVV